MSCRGTNNIRACAAEIVHVENRDGNTPVKFCQAETLKRLFASLRKHGLFIYRFRADCGSYSKEIVETIDAHSNLFYLRASNCESAYTEFAELDGWKTIEINYQKCSNHRHNKDQQ